MRVTKDAALMFFGGVGTTASGRRLARPIDWLIIWLY